MRPVSVRAALLLLASASGILRAQVPADASRGDALPRDDSIYALRVDPAAYHGYDVVLLFEDRVLRLEADGRTAYTLRQVAQILTHDGVENWGELAFWRAPARQRVVINRIRVIGPDGRAVSDGPAHQQETSPQVEAGAPVYSDRRAIQVTLGGVAPGTLVDYSFTTLTDRPWLPGDFLHTWYVNGTTPVRRSRFLLDTPADLDVPVVAENLRTPARDTVVTGRRLRTWVVADFPAVVWQLASGSPNSVVASLRVGGKVSWRDVGAWYDSVSRDRYQLTPEIMAAHARELKGVRTLDDSLRATYRWVAQDFRYVSLSLGDGGYRPREPREVFETRFGDCKDKATLFVALARRMGVVAYPVLVSSNGGVDSLRPSLKPFDHMIAAVQRGAAIHYVDATSPMTPYDELPSALQGEVGLALTQGGARIVVLPASPPIWNRHEEMVVGSLERDGRFVGRVTVSALGTEQYGLRDKLADMRERDATARDDALRSYAQGVYASAVVDSSHYSEGRDLTTPPSVTVWFTAARVVGTVGTRYYFNLPLSRYSDADALKQLDVEGDRRFPIDIARVNSPSVYRSALEFQLPEGWKAELPATVFVEGPFGYYRAEYVQVGRVLRASREMGGLRGLLPPDSVKALRAWLQRVADDRSTMIVLNRGTGVDMVADTSAAPEGGVGTLPDVVLGLGDFPGAKVTREGEAAGTDALAIAFASTKPLESFQRDFGPEHMVFTVGHSRVAAVQLTAAAFHTRAEATRPLQLLDLFDLKTFFGRYLGRVAGAEVSLEGARAIGLSGIGDRATGFVLEMVTPLATFDVAMMFVARGRVCTSLLVVGPQGLQEGDLAGLARVMDQRVQGHEAYLAERAAEPASSRNARAADSALAANTDVALNAIVYRLPDSAGLTATEAGFSREDGSPTYSLSVQGKGLTFPFGNSAAVGVDMKVTLHGTEAEALKEVFVAERLDRARLLRSFMGEMGEMAGLFVGGDSSAVDSTTAVAVSAPSIGARSVAALLKLRGVMQMDVDAVVFARGRLSASVTVTRLPNTSEPPAAATVARELYQRMQRVVPLAREAVPRAALLDGVRRVVEAEHAVDSLTTARDFEAAFRTVERARLAQAPVGFGSSTWNSLCWWASLYGFAQRALPACDAAVAPDSTNLANRDSRGLARGLAGDLTGARDDFAYIVAHADTGAFHDRRAAWLETLRGGSNPFTPEVVKSLKEPSPMLAQ